MADSKQRMILITGVIHTDMLDSCMGDEASSHIKPGPWAKAAVPFLLSLTARDNGKSLRLPG